MMEQDLSYRGLARLACDRDGRGLTHAHLNMLANGHDKPSTRVMRLIAEVCGVSPRYFAEYRLAEAIRDLTVDEVGLDQALANLARFRQPRKRTP